MFYSIVCNSQQVFFLLPRSMNPCKSTSPSISSFREKLCRDWGCTDGRSHQEYGKEPSDFAATALSGWATSTVHWNILSPHLAFRNLDSGSPIQAIPPLSAVSAWASPELTNSHSKVKSILWVPQSTLCISFPILSGFWTERTVCYLNDWFYLGNTWFSSSELPPIFNLILVYRVSRRTSIFSFYRWETWSQEQNIISGTFWDLGLKETKNSKPKGIMLTTGQRKTGKSNWCSQWALIWNSFSFVVPRILLSC